jgi:ribosome production factor 1
MTKKVKNMLFEKNKNKVRSENKLEKEKDRRKQLSKRFKNVPKEIDIKTANNNDLQKEFAQLQKRETSKPGKDIKNKAKRQELILKRAQRKKKIKKKIRTNIKDSGEEVEKTQVKTIDNQREADDTYIEADEELIEEIDNDEFTNYFKGEYDPQILVTSSIRHTATVFKFIKAMKETIPNIYFEYRKKMNIGEMIKFAKEKGYSTLIVITEETKKPVRMSICHLLGEGLTYEFKINNLIYRDEIRGAAAPSDHNPELIFKNFKTKLGFRVQRLFNSLFPLDEELIGRRLVTYHNQRDYIFFRHHRYQFDNDLQKVVLQEIGPSFTLRLLSIQKGFFERESGDYEYKYSDRMGIRRRKFYL